MSNPHPAPWRVVVLPDSTHRRRAFGYVTIKDAEGVNVVQFSAVLIDSDHEAELSLPQRICDAVNAQARLQAQETKALQELAPCDDPTHDPECLGPPDHLPL